MLAVSAAAEFIRCTEAARLICTCKAFNDDSGLRDRTTAGPRENELIQDAVAAYAVAYVTVEFLIRRPEIRHSLVRWRDVLASAPVTRQHLCILQHPLFSALQDLRDATEHWNCIGAGPPVDSWTQALSQHGTGPRDRFARGCPERDDAIPPSHGREDDGITFEIAEAYGLLCQSARIRAVWDR